MPKQSLDCQDLHLLRDLVSSSCHGAPPHLFVTLMGHPFPESGGKAPAKGILA